MHLAQVPPKLILFIMDIEILLPFGIGLLVARLTTMIDKHPDFVTVIGLVCILIALLAKWVKEKNEKIVPSKRIYSEFLEYMLKELKKFKGQTIPSNSFLWFRFKWRRFFPYKPPSEKELMAIKYKYTKWRENLYDSMKLIFDEPTEKSVFPIQTIFENRGKPGQLIDWRDQLRNDFGIIEFLMKFKSLGFSEKYEKAPEKLNEFKDYMK